MLKARYHCYGPNGKISIKYPGEKIAIYTILSLLVLTAVLIIELPIHYYKILRWLQSILLIMCAGVFLRPRFIGYILHPNIKNIDAQRFSPESEELIPSSWEKFLIVSPIIYWKPIFPPKQYELLEEYVSKEIEITCTEPDEVSSEIFNIELNSGNFTPLSYNLSCLTACLAAVVNPAIGVRMDRFSWWILHILIFLVLAYACSVIFKERKDPRVCRLRATESRYKNQYNISNESHKTEEFVLLLLKKYWPLFASFYFLLALIINCEFHKGITNDVLANTLSIAMVPVVVMTSLVVIFSQVFWLFMPTSNRLPTLMIYGTVIFCLLMSHGKWEEWAEIEFYRHSNPVWDEGY